MLDNDHSLERRLYQHYWDDGLLDIFSALGVFLIGVFWLRDLPPAAAIVPALLVPAWQPTRRRLVEPRLGFVEFSDERERLNRRRLRLTLYLGIAAMIVALELYFARKALPAEPAMQLVAGLPAILLAAPAAVTAILIARPQFLVYAVVLLTAGFAGALSGWSPGAIMVAAGAGMFVIAATIFARFLHTNPVDPGSGE
jgi:hypothetical protein